MKITVCAVLAALLIWNGLITWCVTGLLADNQRLEFEVAKQSIDAQHLRALVIGEARHTDKMSNREQELEHVVATLIKALQDANTVPAPSNYNKGE